MANLKWFNSTRDWAPQIFALERAGVDCLEDRHRVTSELETRCDGRESQNALELA